MNRHKRGGFALPILLILLSAVTAFVAVRTLRTFTGFDLRASLRTDRALRDARDALIQHAAWEDSSPGSLVCPDMDNNGSAQASCAAGAIGRFPWRTLGIERLLDGSGECLWYALSPGARSFLQTNTRGPGGSQPALNPGYLGELSLLDSGSGQSTTVIAVVIAPGRALPGQVRTQNIDRCNDGPPSAFLETRAGINNAVGGAGFVTGPPDDAFDDRVLAITSDKLFLVVTARVLIELAGRDAGATTGLREMFAAGKDAPTLLASDGSGHLSLDFLDPVVLAAFSPPPGVSPTPDGSCSNYTPGNVTAEWLCYNRWLDYTQYTPHDAVSASLGLPGWHADFSVATPPRLVRTPTP